MEKGGEKNCQFQQVQKKPRVDGRNPASQLRFHTPKRWLFGISEPSTATTLAILGCAKHTRLRPPLNGRVPRPPRRWKFGVSNRPFRCMGRTVYLPTFVYMKTLEINHSCRFALFRSVMGDVTGFTMGFEKGIDQLLPEREQKVLRVSIFSS